MRMCVCARAYFDPQLIDCLRDDIQCNVTQVHLGHVFFVLFFLNGGRQFISFPCLFACVSLCE